MRRSQITTTSHDGVARRNARRFWSGVAAGTLGFLALASFSVRTMNGARYHDANEWYKTGIEEIVEKIGDSNRFLYRNAGLTEWVMPIDYMTRAQLTRANMNIELLQGQNARLESTQDECEGVDAVAVLAQAAATQYEQPASAAEELAANIVLVDSLLEVNPYPTHVFRTNAENAIGDALETVVNDSGFWMPIAHRMRQMYLAGIAGSKLFAEQGQNALENSTTGSAETNGKFQQDGDFRTLDLGVSQQRPETFYGVIRNMTDMRYAESGLYKEEVARLQLPMRFIDIDGSLRTERVDINALSLFAIDQQDAIGVDREVERRQEFIDFANAELNVLDEIVRRIDAQLPFIGYDEKSPESINSRNPIEVPSSRDIYMQVLDRGSKVFLERAVLEDGRTIDDFHEAYSLLRGRKVQKVNSQGVPYIEKQENADWQKIRDLVAQVQHLERQPVKRQEYVGQLREHRETLRTLLVDTYGERRAAEREKVNLQREFFGEYQSDPEHRRVRRWTEQGLKRPGLQGVILAYYKSEVKVRRDFWERVYDVHTNGDMTLLEAYSRMIYPSWMGGMSAVPVVHDAYKSINYNPERASELENFSPRLDVTSMVANAGRYHRRVLVAEALHDHGLLELSSDPRNDELRALIASDPMIAMSMDEMISWHLVKHKLIRAPERTAAVYTSTGARVDAADTP